MGDREAAGCSGGGFVAPAQRRGVNAAGSADPGLAACARPLSAAAGFDRPGPRHRPLTGSGKAPVTHPAINKSRDPVCLLLTVGLFTAHCLLVGRAGAGSGGRGTLQGLWLNSAPRGPETDTGTHKAWAEAKAALSVPGAHRTPGPSPVLGQGLPDHVWPAPLKPPATSDPG